MVCNEEKDTGQTNKYQDLTTFWIGACIILQDHTKNGKENRGSRNLKVFRIKRPFQDLVILSDII